VNLRRVLILADDSADWIVAGLRQLDRLALAIEEFAVANRVTSPIEVCVFWRPDFDESRRWTPSDPRLSHLAFTSSPEDRPFDLVLTTRLFVYRRAIGQLVADGIAPSLQSVGWDEDFKIAEGSLSSRMGAWEQIVGRGGLSQIETRFLRGSGKSQDGFVSRNLNRPISRTVTRFLLRHPITPNAWTWLISPVFIVAALIMARGTYWSFVFGLILYQVFSILDGCDGEIARAKFMESERGRQLDDLFDVLSNVLLAVGLGAGLGRAHPEFGWLVLGEGIVVAGLTAANEWLLARVPAAEVGADALGGALYPRHRALVARSGFLAFGEEFASLLIQFTKRDVAVLFFLLLALIGLPSVILHLLFVVTAVSLVLALRAR
jgi:phosphatidylglycerophosphate synthase